MERERTRAGTVHEDPYKVNLVDERRRNSKWPMDCVWHEIVVQSVSAEARAQDGNVWTEDTFDSKYILLLRMGTWTEEVNSWNRLRIQMRKM